jgi:hypothetical protein
MVLENTEMKVGLAHLCFMALAACVASSTAHALEAKTLLVCTSKGVVDAGYFFTIMKKNKAYFGSLSESSFAGSKEFFTAAELKLDIKKNDKECLTTFSLKNTNASKFSISMRGEKDQTDIRQTTLNLLSADGKPISDDFKQLKCKLNDPLVKTLDAACVAAK